MQSTSEALGLFSASNLRIWDNNLISLSGAPGGKTGNVLLSTLVFGVFFPKVYGNLPVRENIKLMPLPYREGM